jgi:hypothetical protein
MMEAMMTFETTPTEFVEAGKSALRVSGPRDGTPLVRLQQHAIKDAQIGHER